ncbi:TetR/AcrR family transcriptional regulator [Thaumasiovibrio subtropicus]|uniref:TetR/AcrR family transcriptional regulator n=1 Tax=Thaumasiovibrio subtropicus TaxID=1891207 RepID=UPI000B34BBEE|nr:TetR/AcrR family transcriptional regulator [Thaumasiovibrio subtropicus]
MDTRMHILDTAESLFNQHGYTAVGVDKIRDEASVSKTSLYRHFGGKEGLIDAVLARRHARMLESMNEAVALAGDTVEAKLTALLDWHLTWFKRDDFYGCMFMHVLGEMKTQSVSNSHQAQQHKMALSALVSDILGDEYQANTEFVMIFLEGLIVRAEFDTLPFSRAAYLQMLFKSASIIE